MPVIDGFDISHYQTITDEDAIPRLRLMSCKATEGSTFVDSTLDAHIAMFNRKQPRYHGVYHWIRSDAKTDKQFENFSRAIERIGWIGDGGALKTGKLLQLDWERTYIKRDDGTPVAIPDPPLGMIEEWLGLVNGRFGDRVIVYAGDWISHFIEWRNKNPTYPFWYANYDLKDEPLGATHKIPLYKPDVWQWSSRGTVDGFSEGIDVNEIQVLATLDRISNQSAPPPPPNDGQIPGRIKVPDDLLGDDMPTHCWAPKGYLNEFEMPGAMPVTPSDFIQSTVPGRVDMADPYATLPRTFEFHRQRFLAIIHRNGITPDQIAAGYFIRNKAVPLTQEEKDFYSSLGIDVSD